MSINKVQTNGCLSAFKEYVIQKKWVVVALLITSIVVLMGLVTAGGLIPILSHHSHFFARVFETIGPLGIWTTLIGGAIGAASIFSTSILLDNNGRTSLHHAIENKQSIDDLLNAKTLNETDYDGNTALHYAALNDFGIDQLLRNEHTMINVKNHAGNTPFQVAIKAGNPEAAEKLRDEQQLC